MTADDTASEGASSTTAGIYRIKYRMGDGTDGAGYQEKNTFTVSTAGTYTIYMKAIDKAGNQTVVSKSVTVKSYTVKYDANGGTGAPSAQTAIAGTNITISNTEPTRTYFTFLGWSTDKTATTATYKAGSKYTVNANTTLYAVWQNDIEGAFIKYDVAYKDVYFNKNSESIYFTNINGWRLENYELGEDGVTLSNVRLISTGIPAKMYYYHYDDEGTDKGTSVNANKWMENITGDAKLDKFFKNILNGTIGSDGKVAKNSDYMLSGTYKIEDYQALKAAGAYYYRLGGMQFKKHPTDGSFVQNEGYYRYVKNGSNTYDGTETKKRKRVIFIK